MADKITNVFASLVIVAALTALVLPGRQTGSVITAFTSGFGGDLRAAEGLN